MESTVGETAYGTECESLLGLSFALSALAIALSDIICTYYARPFGITASRGKAALSETIAVVAPPPIDESTAKELAG